MAVYVMYEPTNKGHMSIVDIENNIIKQCEENYLFCNVQILYVKHNEIGFLFHMKFDRHLAYVTKHSTFLR